MDRLILERTQPVQGQPVDVVVRWNDEVVGALVFEFKAWLKFKKLLEKGLEMDAREQYALDLKMTVRGREGQARAVPYERKPMLIDQVGEDQARESKPYRGGVSNMAAEDEEDAEDLAAIQAAEAGSLPPTNLSAEEGDAVIVPGLIRSLRRENTDG